ncbi:hypothetical protein [Tenacibaculum sp. 47A_GOM-205m]|uniref:hypothetical protein n=1 Tax=Tenacibaculum sp. 47A_GOM-205m TaxID=1380384 RepID=UPI00048EB555|nr:hypothetical protein [Tenacibaculum sp. 47A_GOM-205m]
MIFEIGKYRVEIINESDFNPDSKDNSFDYIKEYLPEPEYNLPTKFGIRIFENGIELNSAIIGAEGGAIELHKTSQIIESNRILICSCDSVFCLDFPTLNLNWKTKVDTATAFEIFKIENGFIIHGELEITRIDNDGKVIWQNGGADIFVSQNGNDDFEVKNNFVKATDWNNRIYKWNLNGIEIE